LVSPFVFIHSAGQYGQTQPFEEAIHCEKCGGDLFHINVRPTQFKDWLRETLTRVKPSDQDPAVGFRDGETGRTVRDPRLVRAGTFDEMWRTISPYVDTFGDLNPDYEFDMIRSRHIARRVPGLAHANRNTARLVTVIKDQEGGFWFDVEG